MKDRSKYPGERVLPFKKGILPQAPQQQIAVDSLPQLFCECGSGGFANAINLRFASRFISPTGQPHIVQVPLGWVCTECGSVNKFRKDKGLEEIFPAETPPIMTDDVDPSPLDEGA